MSQIIGRTQGNNFLVEMVSTDITKISGLKQFEIGTKFNLSTIYNRLIWLEQNKDEIKQLAAKLRVYSENIESAANTVNSQSKAIVEGGIIE